MPKWTYDLTISNDTDRPLKLVNQTVCYGRTEQRPDAFPSCIQPGASGIYPVYSPAATPAGIEFYLQFRDVVPTGASNYGEVRIHVNMPYWKHTNESSCTTTGELKEEGFRNIPNGVHNFSTSVKIYRG